ncbi:hypothetical protein [Candidatus Poriferisodalis sp.]|uniref:hypothetical protein n=1 Tax=Candidatus Poriferisodalis sp. TaxID=3101277 RepID=UPI003B025699
MAGLLANPNVPPPNLFTPDFGQEPHVVVGRDALNGALRAGLGGGPRDNRFTSLLLGPRGSGKTVMLNAPMPRAHARCILPVGHAGGHRSR